VKGNPYLRILLLCAGLAAWEAFVRFFQVPRYILPAPSLVAMAFYRGVASMVYYPVPLHLQPLYAALGGKPGDFRVSERASREVLSIPMYPELSRGQIEHVVDSLRAALQD